MEEANKYLPGWDCFVGWSVFILKQNYIVFTHTKKSSSVVIELLFFFDDDCRLAYINSPPHCSMNTRTDFQLTLTFIL